MSSVGTTIRDDTCPLHGEKSYVDCWNCGGAGYSDHDCGEDCCACLYPEDNVRCDICRGKGGYYICGTCSPESLE